MNTIETTFDIEKQITVNIVKGQCLLDEYKSTMFKILAENPTKFSLWDYTKANLSFMKKEDFESLITYYVNLPNLNIREKVALIAPTSLNFGLGRMFSVYTELLHSPCEFRVFRDADDALRWFGINQ